MQEGQLENKKEQRSQKKKLLSEERPNRLGKLEVSIVGVLVCIPFIWMIFEYAHFINVDSEEAINNAFNPRQEILAAQTMRGRILASDHTVLSETVMNSYGEEERSYPFDNLFAHVVGFSTNGKQGIEWLANYQLLQSDISLTSKMENEFNGQKNPGNDVVTTLDMGLQQVASNALGIYQGAVVVLEVQTGKVLAMVSKPDFDPNEIQVIWEDLLADQNSSVLLNRTTQGLYPPGSTFKVITSLAYLRENNNNVANFHYQCNGSLTIDGERITCYHGTSHGSCTFAYAFAKSCNTSFAKIGLELDKNIVNTALEKLYFNQELPLQLSSNSSKVTINDMSTSEEVLQMSIGQGTSVVTPIHMAMITSSIANGGVMLQPYFVDQIIDAEGRLVKEYQGKVLGQVMTVEESTTLKELMEEVVEIGTGTRLKGLSYTVAGKTGSAEYNTNPLDSHAWFIGFAPVEEPEIAIAILVEGAGSGGDYAVPMAKRIFDEYFD